MIESGWLFTGLLATLATAAAIITNDDGFAVMAGIVGFVTWGVWTFGSLNVEVFADSTTYTVSTPELTILGIAWALVPGYIALTGPVNIIQRYRDAEMRDL